MIWSFGFFFFLGLHDDLDEGSLQRRETLLALNMHREIVQRPETSTKRFMYIVIVLREKKVFDEKRNINLVLLISRRVKVHVGNSKMTPSSSSFFKFLRHASNVADVL